ncbi:MAG: hypothetical protein ACRC8S_10010 [Fimbriiglobus sp.]
MAKIYYALPSESGSLLASEIPLPNGRRLGGIGDPMSSRMEPCYGYCDEY